MGGAHHESCKGPPEYEDITTELAALQKAWADSTGSWNVKARVKG